MCSYTKQANKCNAFINNPGLRSFDENMYLQGFISVWNLMKMSVLLVPFLVMWALKRTRCLEMVVS